MNLKILEKCGTSNAALKEFFTAVPAPETATDEEKGAAEKRCKLRKAFEERINSRLWEGLIFSLKNYQFFSAVDLAWEPPPLAPQVFPLIQYAQGKLDLGACVAQLQKLKCVDQFTTKNDKGEITGIDMPKFWEVSVNLVRSIITRRLAAQSNKYNNLYPHYKYESRSTSQVGKLRGDIMSQRADIMADQYGYKHHETQVYRDGLLYGHSVDFIRAAWEKDIQWREKPKAPEDQSESVTFEPECVREGLCWINPHPTRVGWDNEYPLASINTDSGCGYIFFWDLCRYSGIKDNTKYWNRDSISYNSSYIGLFTQYANYFSQYFCTVKPPESMLGKAGWTDLAAANDRKNMVGVYSGEMGDTSVVYANYYDKIVPKDWGLGDYPYETWVRLIVAGWDTVIFGEWLPSSPGAVLSYNEKDDRQINLGMGHELLAYQDQMSNLQSYLLLALRSDNLKVLLLNTDVLGDEQLKAFRQQAKGANFYNQTQILEVSFKLLGDGVGVDVKEPLKLVETRSGTQITMIFQAMLRLMELIERLMALSPQEQGQPAPREISATETNLIAGTTESVYNFISDAIDEYREAKKRIIYESYMAFGEPNFKVPVLGRYTKGVIKKAGLEVESSEMDDEFHTSEFFSGTLLGPRNALIHDYIFSSRDGSERASNMQAAATLTEGLKSFLPVPTVQEVMTKQQFLDVMNEWFRLAGAYDIKLELDSGGDEPMAPAAAEQFQEVLDQMTSTIEDQSKQIQALKQQVEMILGAALPQPNGNGATALPMPSPR